MKYTDSTGHCPDQACWEAQWYANDAWYRARGYRWNEGNGYWSARGPAEVDNPTIGRELLSEAGITLQGDWSDSQIIEVATGVGDLARAVGGVGQLNQLIGGYATFYHPSEPLPWNVLNCLTGSACALPPPLMDGHSVYFKTSDSITRFTTVHELAHIIDWNSSIQHPATYHGVNYLAWGSFSEAWSTYTTGYSRCWGDCVSHWERWADAVTVFVYPGYDGARLRGAEANVMKRLLFGWGWQ